MSKRSPGSKYAIKQGKERYRKEREVHRARLLRRMETPLSVLGETTANPTEQEVAVENNSDNG